MPDNVKYVEVIADGHKRIIVPADTAWDDWFDAPPLDDFMDDRMQPDTQKREDF